MLIHKRDIERVTDVLRAWVYLAAIRVCFEEARPLLSPPNASKSV